MSKPKIKNSPAEDLKILVTTEDEALNSEKELEVSASKELEDESKKADNSEKELPLPTSKPKASEKEKKEPKGTFRCNKFNNK